MRKYMLLKYKMAIRQSVVQPTIPSASEATPKEEETSSTVYLIHGPKKSMTSQNKTLPINRVPR